MTISELQQTANNGQEFFAYSSNGTCFRCRWTNVRRGLFKILECAGKVVKNQDVCDVKGAPQVQVRLVS